MLEVITPADTLDLTTVEAVNLELGLESDTGNDLITERYIAAASDAISRYCKRIFADQVYAQTFHLDEYREGLLLAQFPVAEIVSVVVNSVTLADDAAEVNADSGYLRRMIDNRSTWWPRGKIVVTYRAGFGDVTDIASLPPSIERAAIMLVSQFRTRAERDPAIREVAAGENRVVYGLGPLANGNGMPPEIEMLLAPYRDYRVTR